jgi:hypothetical protein
MHWPVRTVTIRPTWKWSITGAAVIAAFTGTWGVCQGMIGIDTGAASAWAGVIAAVFGAPLGAWASTAISTAPAPPLPAQPVPVRPAHRVGLPLRNPYFVGRAELLDRDQIAALAITLRFCRSVTCPRQVSIRDNI